MIVKAKLLQSIGAAQFAIIAKDEEAPIGRVILLTGNNRAVDAKPGDRIRLERIELDGRVSYRAVKNGED